MATSIRGDHRGDVVGAGHERDPAAAPRAGDLDRAVAEQPAGNGTTHPQAMDGGEWHDVVLPPQAATLDHELLVSHDQLCPVPLPDAAHEAQQRPQRDDRGNDADNLSEQARVTRADEHGDDEREHGDGDQGGAERPCEHCRVRPRSNEEVLAAHVHATPFAVAARTPIRGFSG